MRRILSATLLIVPLLAGCNLLLPEGSWIRARCEDLTDVAHVDVGSTPAYGAAVNLGPAIAGYHRTSGLRFGDRQALGLGGIRHIRTRNDSCVAGAVWPLERAERQDRRGRPLSGYLSHYPGIGSFGIDLGFIFGLGARIDLVELADFFAGIGGVDLVGDDLRFELDETAPDQPSGSRGSDPEADPAPEPGSAPEAGSAPEDQGSAAKSG